MRSILTWRVDSIMSDYTFTPRLDDSGMLNNPFWYSDNPYWQAGTPPPLPPHDYGLPNCTCYAWGRVLEIMTEVGYPNAYQEVHDNLVPNFGHAYTWEYDTLWTTSSEPALGAVAVYETVNDIVPGHVAVVEKMPDADTIVLSESHYGSTYFDTRTVTRAINWYTPGWDVVFKTFIILPISIQPGIGNDLIILLAAMLRRKKRKKGGLI